MTSLGHNGGPPIDDDGYPDRDGFVTIGRSIRNHPIVGFGVKGPYVPAEAWIDLIMECRYREGRVTNGGVVMTIQPGQLLGAVSWLAQRWQWTPKQVRIFLEKLEEDGMITKGYSGPESTISAEASNSGNQSGTHKGKQSHFITLCNYEIYQYVQERKGQIERQSEGQTNGNQTANEGQQYKEEHWNKGTIESPPLPPEGGAREERAAINRDVAGIAYRAYQAMATTLGLPRPLDKSYATHGRTIAARLYEYAEAPKGKAEMLAVLDQLFQNIERSGFLRGMTTNFKIDIEFAFKPKKFAKILSGGFGNGAHATPSQPAATSDTQMRQIDAIMRGGR